MIDKRYQCVLWLHAAGIWENTFLKSNTSPRHFKAMVKGSPSQYTTVRVPTMYQKFYASNFEGARPLVATSEVPVQ